MCTPAWAKTPHNVDQEADTWLAAQLDDAIVSLFQTEYGELSWEHVHVIDGLGTWAAWRKKGKHQGTDFVLDLPPAGNEGRIHVASIIAGRVVSVKPDWGAYGNTVFVLRQEQPKLLFIYAHLDSIWASAGSELLAGELIGTFGCSGNCAGLRGEHIQNQVHVEVYALPEDFEASQVDWDSRPLSQIRSLAVHDKGAAHGIDLLPYLSAHAPTLCDRDTLGEAYGSAAELDAIIAESAEQAKKRRSSRDPGLDSEGAALSKALPVSPGAAPTPAQDSPPRSEAELLDDLLDEAFEP
jgi:murein DD-endopeptidase MepM/ murein hydrolase activator NlpD